MTEAFTFDTNILIYSVDPTDTDKHVVADRIVAATYVAGNGIPLQSLTEFYRASTKKRILPPKVAEDVVRRIARTSQPAPPTVEDMFLAIDINQRDNVPYFDALLLATASRVGCTILFSEDFQHGRTYGSVTVHNPFKLSALELDALLA